MKSELRNLLLSKLLVGLLTGFLLIGLPLYLVDLKINLPDIGLVFGLAAIFYALLSFYFGSSSDFRGRLWIGMISIIGMNISALFFGMMPFFSWTMALALFVLGKIILDLSESLLRNIVKIRVLDLSTPFKLGKNYGFLIFADSSGHALGILLGSALISVLNFQSILLGLAVLSLCSLYFYSKTGDIEKKPQQEKVWKISHLTTTSKTYKIVLLANTVVLFGIYLVDFFGLPLYQKEILHLSNGQIFLLLGTAWLIYGLFSRLGGRMYDQYGIKQLIWSLFLISITSMLLAWVKDLRLFSALLFLDYLFFSFADPARFALVGLVSREKKGMLMSFFEFFSLLMAAVVMLLFGKLVALFGFEFIFILRGLCQFTAMGLLLLIYGKLNAEGDELKLKNGTSGI